MRSGPLRAALAVAATAAAVTAVATSAGAAATKQVPAEWDVAGVAAGARALDLYVNGGGCKGAIRTSAKETSTTVTVTVLQRVPADEGVMCTADYRRETARVSLAAPLNGRSIRGRPAKPSVRVSLEVSAGTDAQGRRLIRVPRLSGMSAREAGRGLKRRGFKVALAYVQRSGRAQVVGQIPRAGGAVRRGATVHLLIGRP
jgi:hypothetical protein